MIRNQWLLSAFCVVSIGLTGQAWANGQITKIEASTAQPVLKDGKVTVKFTVSGSADDSDRCGFEVNYGDGDSPDTRSISKEEGLFPRSFEHTFNKPGGFTVKAKGERVKLLFGCGGGADTFVTVSAPAAASSKSAAGGKPAKAAAVMPTCPDGWQLAAKSYNKTTGAYACSAKPPATKLECGAGLAYYEKDGLIGCRKGK